MKTKIFLLTLSLAFILAVPVANATIYPGYYENFDDDSGTSITSTWYTYTGGGRWEVQSGVYKAGTDNGISGSCSTAQCQFKPNSVGWAQRSWTLEFDVSMTRAQYVGVSCPAPDSYFHTGLGFRLRNAANTVIWTGSMSWSDGTGSPAPQCDKFTLVIPGAGCGYTYDPDDSTLKRNHIVLSYNNVTEVLTTSTSFGNCTQTSASYIEAATGLEFNLVTDSKNSRSVSFIILNLNDGATFEIDDSVPNVGSELDQGLKDVAAGIGFRSPESQMMFSMILIALSEIGMAYLTGFFSPGKWQNWVIHTIAATIGIVVVLLGYLEFWILLVAIVLGTTIVNGGRETLNTFRSLAASARSRLAGDAGAKPEGVAVEQGQRPRPSLEGQEPEPEANEPEQEPEEKQEPVDEPVAETQTEKTEDDF